MEVALHHYLRSEGINSALMPTPEAVAKKGSADLLKTCPHHSPQDLPLYSSRSMTRLKSQQVSKDEVQSVTYGEMYYTPKELPELSNLYRQKSREHV